MRYIYIPRFETEEGKPLEKDVQAYSNLKDCKVFISEYMGNMCKSCNNDVNADRELSVNTKIDLYSHYKWVNTGDYSRRDLEELKFKKCVKGFAEAKYTLYIKIAKLDNTECYKRYNYRVYIDRYKQVN